MFNTEYYVQSIIIRFVLADHVIRLLARRPCNVQVRCNRVK